MANKHEDEYFFDDADIEHFGSEDSDSVVYEHTSEDEDEVHVVSDESVEYEEPNAKWEAVQGQVIDFVSKNKRVVAIVGVALVALITVHFLPLGKSQHRAVQQTHNVPKPQLQPEHVQQLNQNVQTQRTGQVQQTLSRVDGQVSRQSEAMETLARAMDGISKKNNDTLQTMTSLESRLASLSKEVGSLKAKLTAATAAHKPTTQGKGALAPSVTFYVRAIEPGRAWLLGSDNSMTSVSVGALIPGYGRVSKIEDERGLVVLDTSETIGFAPEQMP